MKKKKSKKGGRQQKLSPDKFRFVGIAALAILLIVVLLLVRPLFVGKAIETTAGNRMDVTLEGNTLIFTLTANQPVNAIAFDVRSANFSCGDLIFVQRVGWSYEAVSCVDDVAILAGPTYTGCPSGAPAAACTADADCTAREVCHSGFCAEDGDGNGVADCSIPPPHVDQYSYLVGDLFDAKDGTFEVARATTGLPSFPETVELELERVDVYTSAGRVDLFTGAEDSGDFSVTPAPAPAPQQAAGGGSGGGSGGSGGGGSLTCTRKWECNIWSACSNSKQTRTCTDKNACSPTKEFKFKSYPVVLLGPEKPAETQTCTSPVVKTQAPVAAPVQPVVAKPTPIVQAPQPVEAPQKSKTGYLIAGILVVLLAAGGVVFWYFKKRGQTGGVEEAPAAAPQQGSSSS